MTHGSATTGISEVTSEDPGSSRARGNHGPGIVLDSGGECQQLTKQCLKQLGPEIGRFPGRAKSSQRLAYWA